MSALGQTLRTVAGVAGGLLAWSFVEPYVLDVQRHEVEIPRLPRSWRGRKVALIADLQLGMRMANVATIRQVVRRLVRCRPALVLLAGDFVYHPGEARARTAGRAAELVAPLAAAGVPTYAVLGNHDYAMPTVRAPRDDALACAVRRALTRVGVRVLENEAVALADPDGASGMPLYLVGVGARTPGKEDVPRALSGLPPSAPRLVLMHHPDGFSAFPPGQAPLAVAGHTHGGQFRVPFTPEWTWMTFAREDEVHPDGWISDYGEAGNRLYVNRGIGFSVVPMRLNCPPELTVFTLRGT